MSTASTTAASATAAFTKAASPTAASALIVVTLVSLAGCGGAAKEGAPAQSATPDSQPATVEEAETQLARARIDLDRSVAATLTLPAEPGAAAAQTAPVTPTTPSGGTSSGTRPPADSSAPSANAGTGAPTPSPCEQACRALSSMRRAKEAICRMTGATDARCAQAEKTVAEGEARASKCACPAP